jgi:hypothetical protein
MEDISELKKKQNRAVNEVTPFTPKISVNKKRFSPLFFTK